MATGFAATEELDASTLAGAPVRWPRPSRLGAELRWKPRPAAEAAAALELHTVGDLLAHLPRDSGEARTIAELEGDEVATVIVEVRSITSRPVRRRGMKPLVEAVVSDATGVMKATFFNQPWLKDQYRPGTRLMLAGKYQGANRFRVNTHARTDAVSAVGEAASQYPATKGITSTQSLAAVREHRDAVHDVAEPLPAGLRVAERLPDLSAAFAAAHFGDRERGRARLAFDELLVDQIVQLRLRAERRATQAAAPLRDEPSLSRVWRDTLLPFTLTGDQAAAMEEIDADLAAERPMQRLLMGEVGSGKTVVALHAMLRAVEHGMQAAMMAPTETLAEQHFATLQALMPGSLVPIALLTGSTPGGRRADLLGKLRTGELKLVVCPLVSESEALQARAATAEFERLQATEFAHLSVVLLHGQMRPREKAEAMEAFAAGGADVLVATTVIEVGIDVPNATVMLVEDADRYGISQLHQLRGRIGRGTHESLCLLFGPKESARLRALAQYSDGFRLAEIDLELRGEGEMLGTRQSGLQTFRFARLPEDVELLERARMRARSILDADPELALPEHALIADALVNAYGADAMEPIPA